MRKYSPCFLEFLSVNFLYIFLFKTLLKYILGFSFNEISSFEKEINLLTRTLHKNTRKISSEKIAK